MCPLLPTKPLYQIKTGFEEFVSHIERLVQERRAGRTLPPDYLTPLEWEGLLIWDEIEESYRHAHEAKIAAMFEMVAALVKVG